MSREIVEQLKRTVDALFTLSFNYRAYEVDGRLPDFLGIHVLITRHGGKGPSPWF
jgi:hypothetical protein